MFLTLLAVHFIVYYFLTYFVRLSLVKGKKSPTLKYLFHLQYYKTFRFNYRCGNKSLSVIHGLTSEKKNNRIDLYRHLINILYL